MAAGESSADIIRGALRKAGELVDGSSSYHQIAIEYLNEVYLDVIRGGGFFNLDAGEPWPWARARQPIYLTLKAAYETGSVTLTNASTSGLFSDAPSASLGSFKDRHVQVDGRAEFYRIADHTAGAAAFTLETAYQDETITGSFRAIKVIYDLGTEVLRFAGPIRVDRYSVFRQGDEGKIFFCQENEFFDEYPMLMLGRGLPERFTEIYKSDEEHLIQFSGSVDSDIKVEVPYIPYPEPLTDSKSSYPIVPYEHRNALQFGLAHRLCMDKSDSKADFYLQAATRELQGMMRQSNKQTQHAGDRVGQLIPRRDLIRKNRGSNNSGELL